MTRLLLEFEETKKLYYLRSAMKSYGDRLVSQYDLTQALSPLSVPPSTALNILFLFS